MTYNKFMWVELVILKDEKNKKDKKREREKERIFASDDALEAIGIYGASPQSLIINY